MTDKLSVADVLDRAATLIEPEGAWTQGESARDATGKPLPKCSEPSAVCWCVLGAIGKVIGTPCDPMFPKAQKALGSVLPDNIAPMCDADGEELPLEASWNDSPFRTQAEVVSKLREAANLARERGL